MLTHRYLRAYLAGIAVPTVFLLVFMTGFTLARYVVHVPAPVERLIVFPMAVVPNLWGAWNVFYVWLAGRRSLPIGPFGAVLPLVLIPSAVLLSRVLGVELPSPAARLFPIAFLLLVALYYLLWKHVVRFLNEILEIA